MHAAAGHDQSHAAQSMPHCSDATGLQPAQTCGSADHESASLQRPSTGDDLESGRLDAAVEINASQTDGNLCNEASAALFLQQLVCCPLTQVRLHSGTLFIMKLVSGAYTDMSAHCAARMPLSVFGAMNVRLKSIVPAGRHWWTLCTLWLVYIA